MSRAVDEVLPITLAGDIAADRFVHFPALNFLLALKGLFDLVDADIAGVAHDLEHFALLIARGTDRARPGNVVVDAIGIVGLRPKVQQHKVALANRGGRRCSRLVMRVATMCVDACLLYTSPSPRDRTRSRMPSS